MAAINPNPDRHRPNIAVDTFGNNPGAFTQSAQTYGQGIGNTTLDPEIEGNWVDPFTGFSYDPHDAQQSFLIAQGLDPSKGNEYIGQDTAGPGGNFLYDPSQVEGWWNPPSNVPDNWQDNYRKNEGGGYSPLVSMSQAYQNQFGGGPGGAGGGFGGGGGPGGPGGGLGGAGRPGGFGAAGGGSGFDTSFLIDPSEYFENSPGGREQAYFSFGDQWKTPNQKRFFGRGDTFQNLLNEYRGYLGSEIRGLNEPKNTFLDHLENVDWRDLYYSQSRQQRGETPSYAINPVTRFIG